MSAFAVIGTGAAILGGLGVVKAMVDMYELYNNTDKVVSELHPKDVPLKYRIKTVMERLFHLWGCLALAAGLIAFGVHLATLSPAIPLLQGIIKAGDIFLGYGILAGLNFGMSLYIRTIPTQNHGY